MMTDKKKKQFVMVMSVAAVFLLFYNLASRVNSYSTTLLAFTYKYGFIPRGLLGTIYQGLNDILPFDMNVYAAVNMFALTTTCIYTIFIVWVLAIMLRYIYKYQESLEDISLNKDEMQGFNEANWNSTWGLIAFTMICAIPTFSGYYNFGRIDMFMLIMSLSAVVLLVKDKAIWIIVPLTALGEMFHEAYVFMYFSVVLVLLLHRVITKVVEEKEEKQSGDAEKNSSLGDYIKTAFTNKSVRKYSFVFIAAFIVVSVLFLYFRFGYAYGDKEVADKIYDTAYGMTYDNYVHKDVIRAEILGVDLTEEEMIYRAENFIEFPFFLILMSPFIGILIGFYKRIFKYVKENYSGAVRTVMRFKYLVMVIGVMMLVPLYAMKVDYGRWCFAAVMYYCISILGMMALGDKVAIKAWRETISDLHKKCTFAPLLIGYAFMLAPFTDLSIGKFCYQIYDFPNKIMRMLEIIPFD